MWRSGGTDDVATGATRRRRVRGFVLVALAAAATSTAAGAPEAAPSDPATAPLVRLSWDDDPATTMTIRWRPAGDAAAEVRWRPAGSDEWSTASAEPVDGGSGDVVARASGLAPDTRYEYEIDGGTAVGTFRTAAVDGGFSVAFVADTGIAGRADGLTVATEEVIAAIAAMDPLAVLGGGDFGYFNSDARYRSDQEAGRDAFIDMLAPIASTRPFLPAWGNHEVLLEEDVAEWAARFSTPSGDAAGTSYSFDIAGVHFVALLAYEKALDDATAAWLDADLAAATARGVRTIVPYFHRNTYGNGTVHPPSPSLGRQLDRIFEPYDVQVVLNAHDQSFERTFPMRAEERVGTDRSCIVDGTGITWVKVSPGGKLSNENWDFSEFDGPVPSPEIAVRQRGLHHFAVVNVGADDSIEVVTYGLDPAWSEPIVVDRFRVAASCPPDLSFATQPALVQAERTADGLLDDGGGEPGIDPISVRLVGDAEATLTSDADWAAVAPGAAPGSFTVTIDADALPVGTSAATLTALAPDGRTATQAVVVAVPGSDAPGELVLFGGPDRAASVPLDGATVRDELHVAFATSDRRADVSAVRFELDGEKMRLDQTVPFDLVGGDRFAEPFDTSALPDGTHRLRAVVVDGTGRTTVTTAVFELVNDDPDAEVTGFPEPDEPAQILAPVVQSSSSWWSSAAGLLTIVVLAGLIVGAAAFGLSRRRTAS